MKKLLIGACMSAVLTLGITSCGSGDKSKVDNDSIVPAAMSDSINTYLGMTAGMNFGYDINTAEKNGDTVNRKEFVKGVKFAVLREFNLDFAEGVDRGLQMATTIDWLRKLGVEINRDDILRETRKYVLAEDVKTTDMNAAQVVFENLMTRLTNNGDNKIPISPEMSDSINTYLGMNAGMDLGRRLTMGQQQNFEINRQEFLKGFQFAVARNHDADYRNGIKGGLQVAFLMKNLKDVGVDTDRDVVFGEICSYVNADSINMEEMKKVQATYENLIKRLEFIKSNRDRMRDGLEPEKAPAEPVAAEQTQSQSQSQSLYEAEMVPGRTMTIDTGDGNTMSAEVKQSPSGLIYAIFDEGTGEKIGQQSQALVEYRGMHADGSAFDEGETTFAPVQVIPGFGEGLMMLGKGGKAMFRIPGELGYGPQGFPQAGIQPNETLYFMVAVNDIQ